MLEGEVENPTAREKLTDQEIGNLISAVGNHEAKAITLLAIRDGRIYSSGDLHRAVLSAQGEKVVWRMHNTLPFDYCSQSLAPIGLVVRGLVNPDFPDSPWGYQLTDDGKSKGIPLCGLLLDWSRKHDVSLMQLFGSTSSPSSLKETFKTKEGGEIEFRKRAPITILKILYELITSPNLPVRTVDVANRISEYGGFVGRWLEHLARAGLIQYQATEANAPFSAYKLASSLPPGELPIYSEGSRLLTHAVFSILKEYPDSYLTIQDIHKRLPQALKEHLGGSERTHPSRISGTLALLRRNRYTEIKKFSADLQSEINLTDDQRIILTGLLEIIDRFQDQDPEIIERGEQLAGEIINDPLTVSALLRKAKEASPFANKSPILETKELIRYLISSHPGITNKGIQDLLEGEDKKLSYGRVAHLTMVLLGEGSIGITQKGSVKKFFLHNIAS